MTKNVFKDFDVFSRALVASKDHDPIYPFLKQYFKVFNITKIKDKAWFLFAYVNFYSLESAMEFVKLLPLESWNPAKFRKYREDKTLHKFGIERRASMRNIDNQIEMFNFIKDFIEQILHNHDCTIQISLNSPSKFRSTIESYVPFYGSWSAYKLCELYSEVLDIESLKLKDLGLTGRDPNRDDSPVGGLRWLYGRDRKYTKAAFDVWEQFGGELSNAYGMDIANIETCLCKFHKLSSGKYYVGHDIHELCELRHYLGEPKFRECMRPFNSIFWSDRETVGVIKHLKKLYYNYSFIYGSYGSVVYSPVNVLKLVNSFSVRPV
jgi:hypothetical protein